MLNGFIGGELAPSLFAHTDLDKFRNGASTMRNGFVDYRGGYLSRGGLAYVEKSLQNANNVAPRLMPFEFNINQEYGLEFGEQTIVNAVTGTASSGGLIKLTITSTRGIWSGSTMVVSGVVGTTEANGTWAVTVVDGTHVTLNGSTYTNAYVSGGTTSDISGYMRVVYQGGLITESALNITGVSNANPAVISITAHGYSVGDWISINGVDGIPQLNGLSWIVATVPTSGTFTVTDLFGNVFNNSAAYVSGGTAARIYTTPTPYLAADIYWMKTTQSANTMSIGCINQTTLTEYNTYDLVRNGATNWVFTAVEFQAGIVAPDNLTAAATSSTTTNTYYAYGVTAVSATTGEESIVSNLVSIKNNDISINAGSNSLNWNQVANSSNYNIYSATPFYNAVVPVGVPYGYIGTSVGTSFVDNNITADFTQVPPQHADPFARGKISFVNVTAGGAGFTQSTISYSVTTSTGTGFSGQPIVANGALQSFYITDAGQGYTNGDTITILSGAVNASGTYTFSANPTNGQTIILNGVTWTFVSSAPTATETLIGHNTAVTLSTLAINLNASTNASIDVATYAVSATVLTITYATAGTVGNAYTLAAGSYDGSVSAANLTSGADGVDLGATATLTIGAETGTYPGCVAYYQQRRVYGYTLNNPDTYYMTQPGAYTNMDVSIPVTNNDAITGAPWAQQINGIQAMVPMSQGLMILTGLGAWQLNGGSLVAITPSDQDATTEAYNGCHNQIQPIVVNYDILYVQSKGSIIRDISYNIFANIWTGVDKTVLSSHLFNYHEVQSWAYAEEPYKVIWVVRDDGIMLSYTYLKEQNISAWARHDTNGFFYDVISITELPVDAVYVITKRYIVGQSQWAYYIERMDNRAWTNSENCFCVDAGLSLPMTNPAATLTPAAANGTSNITSVNIGIGGSGYTSPTITAYDSFTNTPGNGATFTATLTNGVITGVTVTNAGQLYTPGYTTLVVTDSTGSGAVLNPIITNYVTFNTSASVFSAGNVGDIIRVGSTNTAIDAGVGVTVNGYGKAEIVTYVSGTQVVANILVPITATIPNDPNNMPVPIVAGQWSISTPASQITGLNHLEGMDVSVVADGGYISGLTVTDGTINLPTACSAVTIGLPFVAQLQTMYLDVPEAGGGTVMGKRKNVSNMSLRVVNSRGISTGVNQPIQSQNPNNQEIPWTDMVDIKEMNATVPMGQSLPLYSGDYWVNLEQPSADNSSYGTVAMQQTYPFPMSISGSSIYYTIGDSGG